MCMGIIPNFFKLLIKYIWVNTDIKSVDPLHKETVAFATVSCIINILM